MTIQIENPGAVYDDINCAPELISRLIEHGVRQITVRQISDDERSGVVECKKTGLRKFKRTTFHRSVAAIGVVAVVAIENESSQAGFRNSSGA